MADESIEALSTIAAGGDDAMESSHISLLLELHRTNTAFMERLANRQEEMLRVMSQMSTNMATVAEQLKNVAETNAKLEEKTKGLDRQTKDLTKFKQRLLGGFGVLTALSGIFEWMLHRVFKH